MNKRFSKTGAALVLVYAVITVGCFIASFVTQGDPKGSFVLLQLPITLQIGPFQALGQGKFVASLGWVASYVIFGIPTIFGLYFVGNMIGRAFRLHCCVTNGSNRSLRRAKNYPFTKP